MVTERTERYWSFAILCAYLLALYYWIKGAFTVFANLVLKIG